MRVRNGIYYRQVGSEVYLRNVHTHRDYLFNGIVLDILELLREPAEEAGLEERLLELYEAEDREAFRRDIRQFTEYLAREGILEGEGAVPEPPAPRSSSVRGDVELRCLEENRLFSAALELTYRCNERCVHCYVDGAEPGGRELTLAEYEDLLGQLRRLGCMRVLLTGGEVCLKPEFPEITRLAVSQGMLVDIYTNGIALDMELFHTLCELGINSVSFSLYGGDAASHDAVTRVPGSFDRTLRWLALFRCAGVDTYIKSVAIRQNAGALESLYRLGRRLNIPVETAFSISDSQTGRSAAEFRLEGYEAYRRAVGELLRYRGGGGAPPEERGVDGPVCLAGRATLSVDPYGGVHPCVAFSEAVGSVRERPLAELWRDADLFRRLRELTFRDVCPDCGACARAGSCQLCPGEAYRGPEGFRPREDVCLLARALEECRT